MPLAKKTNVHQKESVKIGKYTVSFYKVNGGSIITLGTKARYGGYRGKAFIPEKGDNVVSIFKTVPKKEVDPKAIKTTKESNKKVPAVTKKEEVVGSLSTAKAVKKVKAVKASSTAKAVKKVKAVKAPVVTKKKVSKAAATKKKKAINS